MFSKRKIYICNMNFSVVRTFGANPEVDERSSDLIRGLMLSCKLAVLQAPIFNALALVS
jgi:hypothetical protein